MNFRRGISFRMWALIALTVVPAALPSAAMAETQVKSAHVTTHHAMKPEKSTGKAANTRTVRTPEATPAAKVVTTPAPVAVIKPRDVLCVAGCPDGATPPQLVQSGNKPLAVPMQVPETSPNQLEQHSTAIYCFNGGGCRSRGFYRPKQGYGYYDATPQEQSGYPNRNSVYVIER
jgi:hypothetical protein